MAIVSEIINIGRRKVGQQMSQSRRKRLPDERSSITHRFEIGGNKGFITIGMYPDRSLGEVFIVMSKEGSTLSGLLDTVAVTISMALQHGTPVESVVGKLANVKYEPAGMTNNPCIKSADSITDYIGQYMGMKFVDLDTLNRVGVKTKCHDCDKTVEKDGKKYSCIATILTP